MTRPLLPGAPAWGLRCARVRPTPGHPVENHRKSTGTCRSLHKGPWGTGRSSTGHVDSNSAADLGEQQLSTVSTVATTATGITLMSSSVKFCWAPDLGREPGRLPIVRTAWQDSGPHLRASFVPSPVASAFRSSRRHLS